MRVLYHSLLSPTSRKVRIVLAEKGVKVNIVDVVNGNDPDDLPSYNPYNEVPTLVDRDLSLYQAYIIMDYLAERFPPPPLLPVYPVARAQSRHLLLRRQQPPGLAHRDSGADGRDGHRPQKHPHVGRAPHALQGFRGPEALARNAAELLDDEIGRASGRERA